MAGLVTQDPDQQIIQIELNRLKNPNWPEANQLAIYKHETQDYREQIQLEVRARLELGASELQVQCSNHSATLPPASCCLPVVQS